VTDDRYLCVEVRGGEIIVTLPGSNYRVVYHKSAEPGLIAKSRCGNTSHIATMTQAEFHAHAWKLANDQARELGWIG
jgi:hypothetical protein